MTTETLSTLEEQIRRGAQLQSEGDYSGAVACLQRALQLNPQSSAAYNNLGHLFAALGDRTTALTFMRAALVLEPDSAALQNNVANLYLEGGDLKHAIACYLQAIEIRPDIPVYYNNLGNALRKSGRFTEAEASLRRAVHLNPLYADAHVNLAFLFYEQERLAEAEISYRTALDVDPQNAPAHLSLAQILLRKGDYRAGWQEYEWRWKYHQFSSPARHFTAPQWRGEEIAGQSLFVHAEQGFGDTLQFLRYVPLLARRGITVVLEVHPELERIASTLDGDSTLLSRGNVLPAFDWHCPLMSLPLAFGTELETIPAEVPYLRSSPPTRRRQAVSKPGTLCVGIVWGGNPKTPFAQKRAIAPSAFRPLAQLKGVSFYCLQFDPTKDDLRESPLHFVDSLQGQSDFATTAAIMAKLDLVITVDTATAHLAGALGIPFWVLLPKVADWRWLEERRDSPWYPQARLYRQSQSDDWTSVMIEVARALKVLSMARSKRRDAKPFDNASTPAIRIAPQLTRNDSQRQDRQ